VFVLQQKDLTTAEELKVNREKVYEYARKYGMSDPIIFSTSAKFEQEDKDGSGFELVRDYIRKNITGDQNLKLKLHSILATTGNIIEKINSNIANRKQVYEEDLELVGSLRQKIAGSEKQSRYEIERLTDRITQQYERVSKDILHEFRKGLTIPALFRRGFKSVFSKEESLEKWMNDLQKKFKNELHDSIVHIAEDGSQHFINGIKNLTDSLIDKIKAAHARRYEGTELFADTIKRREDLIRQVRENLLKLRDDEELSELIRKSGDIQAGLAGGSALTVVGAIILFSTHIAFFDITGGILTAAGLLVSSGYTLLKRRQIVDEFERNMEASKNRFREQLLANLMSSLEIIYEEIERYFADYFEHVEHEAKAQKRFDDAIASVNKDFTGLKNNAEEL
jgi:hypothetical protein